MRSARVEGAIVNITLRIREDLRRDLEERAKERGVSLNQQIGDCLEHSRDRRSLLPEVLTSTFTAQTAAVALMLARVMEDAGFLHMDRTRRRYYADDIHWIEHANASAEAFSAAIALLTAFPSWPKVKQGKPSTHAIQFARDLVHAIRRHHPRKPKGPIRTFIEDVRSLLGPVSKRLTDPRPSLMPATNTAARLTNEAATTLSDAVFALIQASPNTPSREEIASVIMARQGPQGEQESATDRGDASPPAGEHDREK